jgi:hypothetical protein
LQDRLMQELALASTLHPSLKTLDRLRRQKRIQTLFHSP